MEGAVHSVYRRTVNLLFPEGSGGEPLLLALQEGASPLSPVSLLLPSEAAGLFSGRLRPGDPVTAAPGAVSLPDAEILLTAATAVRDTAIPVIGPDPARRRFLAAAGREILGREGRGGFAPLFTDAGPGDDWVLLAASGRLDAARAALERGDWPAVADRLVSLLGLGGGLTPSGDDFLCGVLAGLTYLGSDAHPLAGELRRRIRDRLGDTHAVSAAFLRCSLDGETSLPVLNFLNLPEDASPARKKEAAEALLSVGHSSGTDSLCGLVFVFSEVLTGS